MMKQPLNFLILGVQKSATTTLDQYLRLHSEIGMPDQKKELHYFDNIENFSKGSAFYNHYFEEKDGKKCLGECTPIYSYWDDVPEKIYDYNPDIKLILVLRNPIDRAFSHWNMEYTHGRENLSFLQALKCEQSRLELMPNKQHRVYSYVDRGHYVSQIKHLWRIFGKKSLLIMKMDELITSPDKTMNILFNFLDLSPLPIKKPIRSYAGNYTGSYNNGMSDKEHDFLIATFEKEIKLLEDLLGWNCQSWLDR